MTEMIELIGESTEEDDYIVFNAADDYVIRTFPCCTEAIDFAKSDDDYVVLRKSLPENKDQLEQLVW